MRAIRKSRRGERVSAEEHDALLRDGLFRGLDKVAAEEEARYVVRYLLSGEDLSDIPPRGPLEVSAPARVSRSSSRWRRFRLPWTRSRFPSR